MLKQLKRMEALFSEEALIKMAVHDRQSVKDISDYFGVNVATITAALDRWQIPYGRKAYLPVSLQQRYSNGELTVDEIARNLGLGTTAVKKRLTRYGLSSPLTATSHR